MKEFFWMRKDLSYIQGLPNKYGIFLNWRGTYYIYGDHLINEGFFYEERPIMYPREIKGIFL